MRLFVEAVLEPSALDEVWSVGQRMQGDPSFPSEMVRWVKREAMHLTLRFLGEVDVERLEDVSDALGALEGSRPPRSAHRGDRIVRRSQAASRLGWIGSRRGIRSTPAAPRSSGPSPDRCGTGARGGRVSASSDARSCAATGDQARPEPRFAQRSMPPRRWRSRRLSSGWRWSNRRCCRMVLAIAGWRSWSCSIWEYHRPPGGAISREFSDAEQPDLEDREGANLRGTA